MKRVVSLYLLCVLCVLSIPISGIAEEAITLEDYNRYVQSLRTMSPDDCERMLTSIGIPYVKEVDETYESITHFLTTDIDYIGSVASFIFSFHSGTFLSAGVLMPININTILAPQEISEETKAQHTQDAFDHFLLWASDLEKLLGIPTGYQIKTGDTESIEYPIKNEVRDNEALLRIFNDFEEIVLIEDYDDTLLLLSKTSEYPAVDIPYCMVSVLYIAPSIDKRMMDNLLHNYPFMGGQSLPMGN